MKESELLGKFSSNLTRLCLVHFSCCYDIHIILNRGKLLDPILCFVFFLFCFCFVGCFISGVLSAELLLGRLSVSNSSKVSIVIFAIFCNRIHTFYSTIACLLNSGHSKT